jgi:hypothetical protein
MSCQPFFLDKELKIYPPQSNQVVQPLTNIDDLAQHCQTLIPMQVLIEIDNGQNPMLLTRDRLERAATENQFMNAKIAALDVSHLLSLPATLGVLTHHSASVLKATVRPGIVPQLSRVGPVPLPPAVRHRYQLVHQHRNRPVDSDITR